MQARKAMSNVLLCLLFFVLGLGAALVVRRLMEWGNTLGLAATVSEVELAPAIADFNEKISGLRKKHSLSDRQIGWILFQHGFGGQFTVLPRKGGSLVGSGYQVKAIGNDNQVWMAGELEGTKVGPRDRRQLVVIDTIGKRIVSVTELPRGVDVEKLDFVMFSDSDIRQFGLKNAVSAIYKRQ